MRIGLIGNPNSGKTTMYNTLTGSNESVGNWAGVTVDIKQSKVKKSFILTENDIFIVDLPGAYSISPFTSEEGVTSDFLKNGNIDVIINIVDATNLSRSLFFTTQLLELSIPTVVALNKTDITMKKQTLIDIAKLSEIIGCPVVETVSSNGSGLFELVKTAIDTASSEQSPKFSFLSERERFEFVKSAVKSVEKRKQLTSDVTLSDKIDNILTNRWLGIPIFALIMFLVFQISQVWLGAYLADGLVALLENFQEYIGSLLNGANPFLYSLLVEGVIGGVIAVVGFLPLVMIMYFLIALLEDCGYMSRVAVILDPIFKRVGLSGKSVIPFVITVGCAVPGIMACRTIRNERERKATAMLAPFMPCGAKIPVISLFAGIFFDNAGWVSTLMYFSGIALIFLGALLINKITATKLQSYFIIELPEYKVPSLLAAFKSMCSRGWGYIVKAATVILLCNTAVQIMQSFTFDFKVAETADSSILAAAAKPFAMVLIPVLGVYSWQLAAAAITGFIAKENVVGTLAVCFVGLENFIDSEELVLVENGEQAAGIIAITKVAALSYLMFNLFTPPCFAAIGAMRSEMKSAKWLMGAIGFQFGVGYGISYLIYTVGTLVLDSSKLKLMPTALGGTVVAVFVVLLTVLAIRNTKRRAL